MTIYKRRFKLMKQARRFAADHAAVSSLFNPGRPLAGAQHYRDIREIASNGWGRAAA